MDRVDTKESWVRLIIIFLIASFGNVGMWSIVTVMPSIEYEFFLDRSQSSLPYTTTMIGFAIGNWVFGRLLDRFGLFYILVGATFFITPNASNIAGLFVLIPCFSHSSRMGPKRSSMFLSKEI